MAYTEINFKTKKALKESFAAGRKLRVYQPGPFGPDVPDGEATIEGPHHPQPHRWYVRVEVKNSVVTKIIG